MNDTKMMFKNIYQMCYNMFNGDVKRVFSNLSCGLPVSYFTGYQQSLATYVQVCISSKTLQVAALETPEISGWHKIIADLKTIIFNLGRQNISYQIDNMEGVKI